MAPRLLLTSLLLASSPSLPSPPSASFAPSSSSSSSAVVAAAAFVAAVPPPRRGPLAAAGGGRRRRTSAAMSSSPSIDAAEAVDDPPPATAAEEVVPGLPPATLDRLVSYAASYGAARGLQVELPSGGGHVVAPISLLPQAYPRDQFSKARSLAGPFNELVDRVGRDGEFLKGTLEDVRGVDEYTGKLMDLYEEIYLGERKGEEWGRHARSADRLGILRSDYMLHRTSTSEEGEGERKYAIKQVELNTIASSFAGLASAVARLHGFLTKRMEGELEEFLEANERAVMGSEAGGGEASDDDGGDDGEVGRGVPESPAMIALPRAMSVAYDRYVRTRGDDESRTDNPPAILFVVQPGETNTVDQRALEFALWDERSIPVTRMSLAEVHARTALDESTGRLTFVDGAAGEREVAVAYFRAGYAPSDYPSGYDTSEGEGVEWLARERLERSLAAKCPCLGYHLAGTKKVQQELARPGCVERFFPDEPKTAGAVRSAFAGLYGLGADATQEDLEAVEDAVSRGGEGRYVLKPQREGGGYNYYGAKLAAKLRENCAVAELDGGGCASVRLGPALSEFILMERLFPPRQRAVLLRNGRVEGTGTTVSELGCFGTVVASGGDEGTIVHNECAGFLLRTKFEGVDEGGVASGFATLSSPYLC